MLKKVSFDKKQNLQSVRTYIRPLLNKELLIAVYFLLFIFGITTRNDYTFYNEYRVIQIVLILGLGLGACFYRRQAILKAELLFFTFIVIGSLFWAQPAFIITDLLLAYLLYKCFSFLNYHQLISKLIVLVSLLMFIQLPFALWDYVSTGAYQAIWYPLRWNIRVYDSYFLIFSIFAVWFYVTQQRYRYLYLLFLFLAFFAILLDGGRSVTIAYTLFVAVVSIAYRSVRWQLVLIYVASWFAYLSVTYVASLNVVSSQPSELRILRTATYERFDLLINAYRCWLQNPILGCGFYQLDNYINIAAHPHNMYLQVLSETGLIGFGFLVYIIAPVIQRIDWQQRSSCFVVAAFLAVGIDLAFSGVHIYPLTQMALLWLFVFLLKNPAFSHAHYFNQVITQDKSRLASILPLLFYLAISIWFVYLFMNTSVFLSEVPVTPPRFWMYGYKL